MFVDCPSQHFLFHFPFFFIAHISSRFCNQFYMKWKVSFQFSGRQEVRTVGGIYRLCHQGMQGQACCNEDWQVIVWIFYEDSDLEDCMSSGFSKLLRCWMIVCVLKRLQTMYPSLTGVIYVSTQNPLKRNIFKRWNPHACHKWLLRVHLNAEKSYRLVKGADLLAYLCFTLDIYSKHLFWLWMKYLVDFIFLYTGMFVF